MKNTTFSDNHTAVSEVIGAMLLVVIAVAAFAIIYTQVFPVKLPGPEPHVQMAGYVSENGEIVLEHIGGEELANYQILVTQSDGVSNKSSSEKSWQIGEPKFLNTSLVNYHLFDQTQQVRVEVITMMQDGSSHVVFDGVITPKNIPPGPIPEPLPDPMSISTLLTNTSDEDLICYSYTIQPNILPAPTAYIYNWMYKTNPDPSAPFVSLTRLLMPFDTQNPFFTKDYSGNNNNGTIVGAVWTNGKLGGAYRFLSGASIALPYCFSVNKIDTVTIEVWIKTDQASGTILSYNRSNYLELGISNGKVKWSTNASDGTVDVNGTITVNDNSWHLIAVTYDATTGVGTIYVDGKLDTSQQAHKTNKLLGSGDSPAGAVGKGTGVTGRKTIFSTDFESRDETNNWNEDNSSSSGIKDAVDSNASNVDSSADKGIEANFTNTQGISTDSKVMTIQESNYGLAAVSEHLYVDGITNTSIGWTFTGPGAALQNIGGGKIRTRNDGDNRSWFTFSNTASTGNSLTVSLSFYVTEADGNDKINWGIDTTGDTKPEYTGTITPATSTSKWYNTGTIGGLTTGALVNSSRVFIKYAKSGTTANYMTVDAAQLNVTRSASPNYQIDFEYKWTAAIYNMVNEQVCLYITSHTGSENLLVNYWTGSAWSSLGSLASSGWYNVTATGLTSSTFTIQLKGASEASDVSQDTWNIDVIFLHVWTTQHTFDMLPSTALTPHAGSYSLGGSGDFYPLYTYFNRTDVTLSGYQNVQLSVWYSYKDTESNDFFGLYYKNNSQWNPVFEITNPIQSGQKEWTQVIITLPSTLDTLRLQFKWRTTSSSEYVAIDDLKITGIPLGVDSNFTGIIDEVKIYQRGLSPEQLYQNYLCTKDGTSSCSVLTSKEICNDERWKCLVTPNNGFLDDVITESNLIVVKMYTGGG